MAKVNSIVGVSKKECKKEERKKNEERKGLNRE